MMERDEQTDLHPQKDEIGPPIIDPGSGSPIRFEEAASATRWRRRPWLYALIAITVLVFAPGGYGAFHSRHARPPFPSMETGAAEFRYRLRCHGRTIADEWVLRDVSPADDGALQLYLSTVLGMPSISPIETLEGAPRKQLPIRIVTQPSSFTDRNGEVSHPDNYFLGGRSLSHELSVTGLADQDLPSVERYGHFSYAFPIDPRDRYTVVL